MILQFVVNQLDSSLQTQAASFTICFAQLTLQPLLTVDHSAVIALSLALGVPVSPPSLCEWFRTSLVMAAMSAAVAQSFASALFLFGVPIAIVAADL